MLSGSVQALARWIQRQGYGSVQSALWPISQMIEGSLGSIGKMLTEIPPVSLCCGPNLYSSGALNDTRIAVAGIQRQTAARVRR